MGRKFNEQRLKNEAAPADIRKGDVVEVVTPWNFFRGDTIRRHRPGDTRGDIYTVETWEVAAIGKRLMRLYRRSFNTTYKSNIHCDFITADGTPAFLGYIAVKGNGFALAQELADTDPGTTNPRFLTPEQAAATRPEIS